MSGRPSRRGRLNDEFNTMAGSLSLADLSPDILEKILQQLERDVSGKNDCKSMRQACDNMKQLARVYNVVVPCNDPDFWKARCTENNWLFGSTDYVPIDTESGPDSLDRWKKQYHLFCNIANHEHRTDAHLENIRQLGSSDEIGETAFMNCRPLRLTHLPNRVEKIKHRAFTGCPYLTLKNGLPAGLKYIGGDVFYGCLRLNFERLPTNLKYIEMGAFAYCKKLTLSGPPPPNLMSIRDHTFASCTRLAPQALPPTLLFVGAEAFSCCQSMRLTTLPDTLRTIKGYGFAKCRNLALTKLPEDLSWIGLCAFEQCESLQFKDFPDKMKDRSTRAYIAPYAFKSCEEPIQELARRLYKHLNLEEYDPIHERRLRIMGYKLGSSDHNEHFPRMQQLKEVLFFSELEAKVAVAETLEELKELERELKAEVSAPEKKAVAMQM